METQALQKVEQYALNKLNIFVSSKIRYVLRSILASMFIGFGITAASKTGSYFSMADSPFAFPAAAVTFGAAILLIAYGGGDLFTGNTFYFTYTALRKNSLARHPVPVDVKLCRQFDRRHSICHSDQRDRAF